MKAALHIRTMALLLMGGLAAAFFPPALHGTESPEEEVEIIQYPATIILPQYCWIELPVRVLDMPPGLSCINYTDSSAYAEVRPVPSGTGTWSFLLRGRGLNGSFFKTSDGNPFPFYTPELKSVVAPKPNISVNILNPDGATYIASTQDARVHISVVPDATFAATWPREARYAVGRIDVLVQQNPGAPSLVHTVNCNGLDMAKGVEIDMTPYVMNLPVETKCYIKLDNVYRITSDNKRIDVPFSERDLYVGLIVKPKNSGK